MDIDLVFQAYIPDPKDPLEKYYLPLLKSLVEFAPRPQARANVCEDIVSCTNVTGEPDFVKLRELLSGSTASSYYPVRMFPSLSRPVVQCCSQVRAAGGRTPLVSSHSSNQVAIEQEAVNAEPLERAKSDSTVLKYLVCLHQVTVVTLTKSPLVDSTS